MCNTYSKKFYTKNIIIYFLFSKDLYIAPKCNRLHFIFKTLNVIENETQH